MMFNTIGPRLLGGLVLVSGPPVITGVSARAQIMPGPASSPLPLGTLSGLRDMAEDCLRLAAARQLGDAGTRLAALKAAWDAAEPAIRPRDAAAWNTISAALDAALADLRSGTSDIPHCIASLRRLVKRIDAGLRHGARHRLALK